MLSDPQWQAHEDIYNNHQNIFMVGILVSNLRLYKFTRHMTTSTFPSLQSNYIVSPQHQDNSSPYCTLQWRRGQLLVKSPVQVKQPYLLSLDRKKSLVECLTHSPVHLVSIDPSLGESWLRFWADACEQANKPFYLSLPAAYKRRKLSNPLFIWLKLQIERTIALILLFILSPILLILMLLMWLYSPGVLFSRDWCVGERGKLFRVIKFRTSIQPDMTSIGYWLYKYGLENLPQLWNVVRGEMSLLSPHCWTLEAAVRLNSARQKRLHQLTKINAAWDVEEIALR